MQRGKPKQPISQTPSVKSSQVPEKHSAAETASRSPRNFIQKIKAFVTKPEKSRNGHRIQRANSSPVFQLESKKAAEENSNILFPIDELTRIEKIPDDNLTELDYNSRIDNSSIRKIRSISNPAKPNLSSDRIHQDTEGKGASSEIFRTVPKMQFTDFANNLPHRLNSVKGDMNEGLMVYEIFLSSIESVVQFQKKCANECLKVMNDFIEQIEKCNLERHSRLKNYYLKSAELMMGLSGSQLNFIENFQDEVAIPLSRNLQIFQLSRDKVLSRHENLRAEYQDAEEKTHKGREEFFKMWEEYASLSSQKNENAYSLKG
jgi:hypothetical protein